MSSVTRRGLVVGAGAVLASVVLGARRAAARPPKAEEAPIPTFRVSVAVAADESDGAPAVRDEAWIDAQLAVADRLFGAHGVRFVKDTVRPISPYHARLENRPDRDALAALLQRGVINVFVVGALRDVDDPVRHRMGVHWRPKAALHKHYVILAANAMTSTLAHELGHFFGNGHSPTIDNVMSYERSGDDGALFFDDKQVKKIRSMARFYSRTRELVAEGPRRADG